MKRNSIIIIAASILLLLAAYYLTAHKVEQQSPKSADLSGSQQHLATPTQSNQKTSNAQSSILDHVQLRQQRDLNLVLQDIYQITERTDGRQVYSWFLELQQSLNKNSESAKIIGQKISGMDSTDASKRRQLSVLYGALAQSDSSESLSTLLQAVAADQDEYHMIQAISAVGDHVSPNVEAAELMWVQSQSHPQPLVRHTALLALGSIAHRNNDHAEYVGGQLVDLARDSSDDRQRGVLISAMGNHGDPRYWPYLQEQIQDTDENIRAAAIYASRFLPQAEVNSWIRGVAAADQSLYLKNEALKVLGIRSEFFDLSEAVTEIAISSASLELHVHAAKLLNTMALDYPDSARKALHQLQQASEHEAITNL